MGCRKSKHSAVAAGNTTTISNSNKRLNASESCAMRSSSKKLKSEQELGKSLSMKNMTEKVQNSAVTSACLGPTPQAEKGKGREGQWNGGMSWSGDNGGAVSEVDDMAKDRKPRGGEKEETERTEAAEEAANAGGGVEGAEEGFIWQELPNRFPGEGVNKEINSKGQSAYNSTGQDVGKEEETNENAKVAKCVMKEKGPVKEMKKAKEEEKARDEKDPTPNGVMVSFELESNRTTYRTTETIPMKRHCCVQENGVTSATKEKKDIDSKGQSEYELTRQEVGKEEDTNENVKVAQDVMEEKGTYKEMKADNGIKEAAEEEKDRDEKDQTSNEETGVTSAIEEKKAT